MCSLSGQDSFMFIYHRNVAILIKVCGPQSSSSFPKNCNYCADQVRATTAQDKYHLLFHNYVSLRPNVAT